VIKENEYVYTEFSHEYLYDLANKIYQFCAEASWDITVVNDADDSWLELWRDQGYVETHTRYTDEKPRGTWEQRMED
jgi:hypothetical protein